MPVRVVWAHTNVQIVFLVCVAAREPAVPWKCLSYNTRTMADLAPCVAVIGPPNSGKTTLLHLLDSALQHHPDAPLAYVVKGSPDGSGRYLHRAPDLRE